MGALFGISCGIRNETKGFIGAMFGLNLVMFAPIVWYTSWLDADVRSYKSLQFVGVPNAFALMLLVWIAIFTTTHEEAEKSLGRAISDAIMMTSVPKIPQDSEPPRNLDEF
ncbi:hypothetical protein ACHAXA_009736 [Cyclostephanos tholiformis]|uniref:Uncharacterized protein n=1 Tax=Cyclostephanos tholiformis TaxID=382380 RepID=A0ABD3R926_9STRA